MKILKGILVASLVLALGMALLLWQYPGSASVQIRAPQAALAQQADNLPGAVEKTLGPGTGSGELPPLTKPAENYAQNHEALWASLDVDGYEWVSDFSARYSDALQFINHGQLSWMQRHGYPMPGDILAAVQMSDAQLRELASAGDSPATAMFLDRLISDAATLGRKLLDEGVDPYTDPVFFRLVRDMMHYQGVLYASGTPFAGYMDARAQMEVFGIKTTTAHYGEIVEIALMGLAFAHGRGDQLARNRAQWLADEAGVDPEVFTNYLSYHNFYNNKWQTICEPGNRRQDSMPYGLDP